MKTNQEYKNAALAALKGKWTPSVCATLVLIAMMVAVVIIAVIVEFAVGTDPDSEIMSPWFYLIIYGFLMLFYYP